MSVLFCCESFEAYKPRVLDHEAKFRSFMTWARAVNENSQIGSPVGSFEELSPLYAIQLVSQINFGPLESKRYFIPSNAMESTYNEITESDLIKANFQKLNS